MFSGIDPNNFDQWLDGSSATSYTNWCPFEPSNPPPAPVYMMGDKFEDGYCWDDRTTDDALGYICEKDIRNKEQ